MIHGHGRKGDANLCGIMRNDYNILLRLLRLTRKLPRLSLLNLAQRYTMPYKEVTGILTDIGISVSILRHYFSMNVVSRISVL